MFNSQNNNGGNPNHDASGKFTSGPNRAKRAGLSYEDKIKIRLGMKNPNDFAPNPKVSQHNSKIANRIMKLGTKNPSNFVPNPKTLQHNHEVINRILKLSPKAKINPEKLKEFMIKNEVGNRLDSDGVLFSTNPLTGIHGPETPAKWGNYLYDYIKGMSIVDISKKYGMSKNGVHRNIMNALGSLTERPYVEKYSDFITHPDKEKMLEQRRAILKQMGLSDNNIEEK